MVAIVKSQDDLVFCYLLGQRHDFVQIMKDMAMKLRWKKIDMQINLSWSYELMFKSVFGIAVVIVVVVLKKLFYKKYF